MGVGTAGEGRLKPQKLLSQSQMPSSRGCQLAAWPSWVVWLALLAAPEMWSERRREEEMPLWDKRHCWRKLVGFPGEALNRGAGGKRRVFLKSALGSTKSSISLCSRFRPTSSVKMASTRCAGACCPRFFGLNKHDCEQACAELSLWTGTNP